MTIRVSVAVRDKLDRLAQGTLWSRSFLAAEAVAAYVDRELAIIEGVERGLADVAAGLTTPHDVAMRQAESLIAKAKAARG